MQRSWLGKLNNQSKAYRTGMLSSVRSLAIDPQNTFAPLYGHEEHITNTGRLRHRDVLQ